MDYSGTIPATGVPPPAPPPPPPTLNTSKILGSSWRTSTNCDNIGSVQTAKSPERSLPFAGVHPETLQHAAQRLRPTVYRESLLPYEREQFLDGSDQLASGRYWQNQPQHDTLAQHQTGTTVHATHDYSHQSPAFGVNSGYSPSMSPSIQQQQQSSNFNSNNNKQYQQYSYKPQQKQNMEIKIPIQLIGPLPGQTNFGPKTSYSPTPSPINSFIKQTSQQTNFNHRQSPLLQQQQQQSSSSQQQLINDPKRYIHAYATQTPVATLMTGQNGGGIRENNFGRENEFLTSNGSGGGIHLRKQNVDNFVKELRDQGLTERQRVANQQQKPVNYSSTSEPPPSLQNFVSYKQKIINSNLKEENKEDSVDQLIKEMEWKMRSGYGAAGENYCTKCRQQISGDPPGVTALGQPYHVTCFCCDQCQKQLAGCSFYAVDGKNLCQVDYMNSLEKCGKCKMPITQKILRALGKAFHPECFVCPTCQKSLDGIQFTVDSENSAYCLDCFHERFSPRCASCLKVIAPSGNETEVARVIAMDRSYHLDCYKCEDCGLKLNSKIEGQGCYPLESHLFCKNCNLKRLKLVK